MDEDENEDGEAREGRASNRDRIIATGVSTSFFHNYSSWNEFLDAAAWGRPITGDTTASRARTADARREWSRSRAKLRCEFVRERSEGRDPSAACNADRARGQGHGTR